MYLQEKGSFFSYNFILRFLASLTISYLMTMAGVLILAFLLLMFHIPIELTDRILYGIHWSAVAFGVICMGKRIHSERRLQGFFLGLSYCMILFILSCFLNEEFQFWKREHVFIIISVCIVGGMTEFVFKRIAGCGITK